MLNGNYEHYQAVETLLTAVVSTVDGHVLSSQVSENSQTAAETTRVVVVVWSKAKWLTVANPCCILPDLNHLVLPASACIQCRLIVIYGRVRLVSSQEMKIKKE